MPSRKTLALVEIEELTDICEYVECQITEAELIIEVNIARPSPLPSVVHSFEFKRQPDSNCPGIHWANRHWAACGSKGGHGGYVSLNSADGDSAVIVTMSIYWNNDGVHGEAEGTLQVPWLGEAQRVFGNGVTVQTQIFEVGQKRDES